MASSINPYNINGNYPVAGQDNDSQGFRDNFTNLRNNLVFAKTEIEDLQRNAVLKNALAGTSLDNNLAGAEIGAPKLRSWTETRVTEAGAVGTVDVNFNYGNFYHITPVGDVTLTLSNFPNAGYGCVRVWFTITNVSHNVTLPSGLLGAENITGYDSATSTITFPATGSYLLEISTFDRTTYLARDLTKTSTDGIALSDLSVVTNSPGTAALTYNSGTGVFTFTPPDLGTAPLTLTGLSVTNASAGNISLSYNNSTGVFTFTPPVGLSVTTASAGNIALSYDNSTGVLTFTPPAAPDLNDIDDVVITTPAEKDILYYNSSDSTWVNSSLSTVLNSLNTAQLIEDGDAIDLGSKAGYFSTIAASTSTLAAGVEGDIKVFAMETDGGDMVITVTNAGWKTTGTGTITFSAIGQACQLQYISGKWFCIGNNGAAFA